jgi:galactose mutarotase-like enzyme
MDIKLENNQLSLLITEKGAELTSIKSKRNNSEYLWTGDPKHWNRHSPILFPIVGRLKNNIYTLNDHIYSLNQHGFARDCMFQSTNLTSSSVQFKLLWTEDTLKVYPYKFELTVTYILIDNSIDVLFSVKNTDSCNMYFSIGAHPAFNCPIYSNESMEDYYFEFEKDETACTIPVNDDGLLIPNTKPFMNNTKVIPLNNTLFKHDALVFDSLISSKIHLKNTKNSSVISLDFKGFPYLGLWSKAEGAPFVCIEPWYGHADFIDSDGDFINKPGIINIGPNEEFASKYTISIDV